MDNTSFNLEDHRNKLFVENTALFNRTKNNLSMKNINPKDYQIIYFAGGHGTMWDFPIDENVHRVTGNIYEQGGIVSAVCHGPAAFVNLKLSNGKFLVEGKNLTAFSNSEEEAAQLTKIVPFALESKLIEQKAKYSKADLWKSHVVIDDRLITGQNPASAEEVAKAIVKLIKTNPSYTKKVNNHK